MSKRPTSRQVTLVLDANDAERLVDFLGYANWNYHNDVASGLTDDPDQAEKKAARANELSYEIARQIHEQKNMR